MDDLTENIQKLISDIIERDLIAYDDLNKRIVDCIKKLSENESLHILDNFLSADFSAIEDKENFLFESFQDHIKSVQYNEEANESVKEQNVDKKPDPIEYLQINIKDISNKPKIVELLDKRGYTLVISSSQRRYGGPPPNWNGPPPGCGDQKFCSQVHIGKLGKDIFEDVLVPILESQGRIYQLRIMVNPHTGENKGYAFCDFYTKEEAQKFIEAYHEKPLYDSGPTITATLSIPKCRLHISGFTTHRSKEEVELELKNVLPSASEISAFSYRDNKKRNRGFAFLSFFSHNDASIAKRQIATGKIVIFGQILRNVEWAEPPNDSSESSIVDKKRIFVRFGTLKMDVEKITSLFKEFGDVYDVKCLDTYAFLSFNSLDAAANAISSMDKKCIENVALEVGYAKKVSDRSGSNMRRRKRGDRFSRDRRQDYVSRRDGDADYRKPHWRDPYPQPPRDYNRYERHVPYDRHPYEDYHASQSYSQHQPRGYRDMPPQGYPSYDREQYHQPHYYPVEHDSYRRDRDLPYPNPREPPVVQGRVDHTNLSQPYASSSAGAPAAKNVYLPLAVDEPPPSYGGTPSRSVMQPSYRPPFATSQPSSYPIDPDSSRYPPANTGYDLTSDQCPSYTGVPSTHPGYASSNVRYWS